MRKVVFSILVGLSVISTSVFAQENELRALLESLDNASKANDTILLSSLFLHNNENDVKVSNAYIKLLLMKPSLNAFEEMTKKSILKR